MVEQEQNTLEIPKPQWCQCEHFSCESYTEFDQRYRMVKDNGVITDRVTLDGIDYKGGDTVPNCIANCEIKERIFHKDKYGEYHKELKKVKPGQKKGKR